MFASRHRAAILSDIIINKNRKLLHINYLARKVDVLFNFPSTSHCTCNRTYGKTRYIIRVCFNAGVVHDMMGLCTLKV